MSETNQSNVAVPPVKLETTINDEEEWRRKQIEKNQGLIHLLQSWLEDEESAEEQRETWEWLRKALDEDRLSYRKLFPDNE